jgi:cobalt-zinc-cadmium efflux system membrane fusion protein
MPPNPRQSLLFRQHRSTQKWLLLASFLISMLFVASARTWAQAPGVRPSMARETPVEAPNTSNSESREQPVAARQRIPRSIDQGLRIAVPKSSPLRNKLTIAAVSSGEIQRRLDLPGVVEADPTRTVEVLPPVTGRVVDLKVRIGDRVAQQQELAVIYVGGSAGTGRADVVSSPNSADTQIGFGRVGDGGAPADQWAARGIKQPAGKLRAFGRPVEGMKETRLLSLRAPVAGSVIELPIADGTLLKETWAPMMTIANLETIQVATKVPNKEMATIAKGQPVQVRFPAYPGEDFKGEILVIGDPIDRDGLSTKVRIVLQNPNIRLKLNMDAYAMFSQRKEAVTVVPISALVPTYSMDLVLVETAPWVFEARTVGISFLEDGQVIVASGLKVGERVVVRGVASLLASRSH